MDLKKMLKELGVEKNEARRVANIIESANQIELMYMVMFIEGVKIGILIERHRRENR